MSRGCGHGSGGSRWPGRHSRVLVLKDRGSARRSSRSGRLRGPHRGSGSDTSPSPARRNETGSPGPLGLLSEEGGCFSQDLPLGLEDFHPPAQLGELGPLVVVEWRPGRTLVRETDPLAERLVRDAEVHRDLADREPRRLGHLHGLGAELGAVVTVLPPHAGLLPADAAAILGVHGNGVSPGSRVALWVSRATVIEPVALNLRVSG